MRHDRDGVRPRVGARAWDRASATAAHARLDLVLVGLDAVLVALAYAAVLALRFDGVVPPPWRAKFGGFLLTAVVAHLLANVAAGLYGRVWGHAGVDEARRLLIANGLAAAVLGALHLPGDRTVPLTVAVLGPLVAMGLIGALRFYSRLFAFKRKGADLVRRVMVVGCGEAGAALVRDMLARPEAGLLPVAALDDDPRKHGRSMFGVPILGPLDTLGEHAARTHADLVLLALPSADSALVRAVTEQAEAARLTMKVLPGVSEMVDGTVSVRDVRDLEIGDLLGRQQVETDLSSVAAALQGRRVLITGAGGSIGSEIARQVAQFVPAALVLLDQDETHLHDAAGSIALPCHQVLADVRDRDAMQRVFSEHAPEVVFHAAAHKHVPLLEDHPCEAVRTNVLGTRNVAEVARSCGVDRFVFVSTDKAVRPASVMGATKRLGELLLFANRPESSNWCAVRFGNVLGSRGSVIPTFARQIAKGGPVTVTDARMTRFFMSVEEAVQLVLQAGSLPHDGEIFMLEMGEPVRILDLAERMIRLSGRQVGIDVVIDLVGVRPGEKLREELRAPDEQARATVHPGIVAVTPTVPEPARLSAALAELEDAVRLHDDGMARRALASLVDGQFADAELAGNTTLR